MPLPSWRGNYALDQDEAFWNFQYVILDQDKPIVESQRPEELPLDMSAELYVKGADLTGVLYRRWLLEFAAGRFVLSDYPTDEQAAGPARPY